MRSLYSVSLPMHNSMRPRMKRKLTFSLMPSRFFCSRLDSNHSSITWRASKRASDSTRVRKLKLNSTFASRSLIFLSSLAVSSIIHSHKFDLAQSRLFEVELVRRWSASLKPSLKCTNLLGRPKRFFLEIFPFSNPFWLFPQSKALLQGVDDASCYVSTVYSRKLTSFNNSSGTRVLSQLNRIRFSGSPRRSCTRSNPTGQARRWEQKICSWERRKGRVGWARSERRYKFCLDFSVSLISQFRRKVWCIVVYTLV